MSQIQINGKQFVEGKFSFDVELDDTSKPPKVIIQGAFQSAEYIEEIIELEGDRHKLSNIKVYHESFGSEEDNIVYSFTAGNFHVKPRKRE